MGKFRIACHVLTWSGLADNAAAPVFRQVAEAGYDGVEGLTFHSAEQLVETVAHARTWGLQVVTAAARTPEQMIRYTAAIGGTACEIWEGAAKDFERPGMTAEERFLAVGTYFAPYFAEGARYGIKLYHHIHLNQLVVTMEDVDTMVRTMPEMGILLDTGHLAAAGGDALEVIRKHQDRIVHVHLKDFHREAKWDFRNTDWDQGYFVPLGEGNAGVDVPAIMQGLEQIGYRGWVSCELDPLPALMARGIPPRELVRRNREYLRSLGY